MSHQIRTVYVVHHSHTDIGYTDLQERIIDVQTDYIRTVLSMMEKPEYADFRWNCETLFCVEEFFKTASEKEKEAFLRLVREGKLGISANYLNFTDLLEVPVYHERLEQWKKYFQENDVPFRTAMFADINGISMGYRDAMIDQGIEFLYTNIHCHHGMYPLYKNQTAYWWENAAGKRILVWNGEHYNLGNALGIKSNPAIAYMQRTYFGQEHLNDDVVEALHENLMKYLDSCESQGYEYDFIAASVSGVFSDNAPPCAEILENIKAYNEKYGDDVQLRMVSLQELYAQIRERLANAPVYRGDLTDWWANGIGSTPYAVKHYREAQHRYRLCHRLEERMAEKYPAYVKAAQDNMLLYAEHTWGHSATIVNPYTTMVLNLDMRKNGYASGAHEASSRMLNAIIKEKGDLLRYYNTEGKIKACAVSKEGGRQLVEFYIETMAMPEAQVMDETGKIIPCQVSAHPRGRMISFTDEFEAGQEKTYAYRVMPAVPDVMNTRQCYVGSENVKDIVNEYDPETYRLPYGFENRFFRLAYCSGEGVSSFVDKRTGRELTGRGEVPFFTPVYEVTKVRYDNADPYPEELERRLMGRNMRGQHAKLYTGTLEEITIEERGAVFTQLRLKYSLPGTIRADVVLRFFEDMPRVDFKLELGKTISTDIESIFLPLSLDFGSDSLYLRKGAEAFRPGIDQLPGTCMEFYMSDDGIAYTSPQGGAVIAARDTALLYMGQLRHHPIVLCDGKEENNRRPVYSWVMNNIWETNFKMDLSGFGEYRYSLWLTDETDGEAAMDALREKTFDPYVLIIE